jgi:hypothetical protein
METLAFVVVAAFIAHRLAVLIALEEGPFSLATTLRNQFLNQDWIGRGIRCVLCVSFWSSLLAALLVFGFTTSILAHWFSVAGLSYLISKKFTLER